jgi:hypothetical protein
VPATAVINHATVFMVAGNIIENVSSGFPAIRSTT